MTAELNVSELRRQGRAQLFSIAQIVLSAALVGWLINRTPLESGTISALCGVMFFTPLHFLIPPPVRICVRIAGLTGSMLALHSLIGGEYFVVSAVAAWATLTTIVVNQHIKRG